MYKERKSIYQELEKSRNTKLIVYVTSDRQGLETQIGDDVYSFFVNHLDIIGKVPKISLYLYTRGGNTLTAWSLVNLIRQFCDDFEIIVPSKCHSAGTLICLGANSILMTKQATLGPIDPSVNTPLNPQIPGGNPASKVPVSVESINGFIELAKNEFNIKKDKNLSDILINLMNKIHPLVLGNVYRARSQIKMLAEKLITNHINEPEKVSAIISFLCSESGSHDYSIHRKEASELLGLNIETPDDEQYNLIKAVYNDIENELELNNKLEFNTFLGAESDKSFSFKRALLESVNGGSDFFVTEGVASKISPTPPQFVINTQLTFEGWRHENVK